MAFPIKITTRSPNMSVDAMSVDAITLEMLKEAKEAVRTSPLKVVKTPLIPWSSTALPPPPVPCNIHIKLENLQRTGNVMIRGVANQFARRPKGGHFITMTTGSYGLSLAYAAKHYGFKAKVVLAAEDTSPQISPKLIESFGVECAYVPKIDMMGVVNRSVLQEKMTFLHPYDDLELIAGHGSLGMEILEQMPDVDVVVVGCGGGAVLSGLAAGIKLSGSHARVYGVEPEGACRMHQSFIEKKPVYMEGKTAVIGLDMPFEGVLCYKMCQRYVEGIVLVSDEMVKAANRTLHQARLMVEITGTAAYSAIVNNKIPDIAGKNVAIVCTGGNWRSYELSNFPETPADCLEV